MDVDIVHDDSFRRRRRAIAVQLYTQQLGVAHLRSKAAAAHGSPAINLTGTRAPSGSLRQRIAPEDAAAKPAGQQPASVAASASEALRVVYGTPDAEAIALEQQRLLQQQEPPGQQQHQPRQQRLHQRRRRPVPVELPGFSPRRSAEADERAKAAIRPAVSPGAASGMPDRGPPPGWVTVNADGEEIEVAPADADDFIMEAADVAVFDEEEWV